MQNASALYLSCQIHRRELQQNSLIAQEHKGWVKDRATPVATVKMKVTEKEEIAGSDQIKDKEKGDKLQRAPSTTEWQQTPNPEGTLRCALSSNRTVQIWYELSLRRRVPNVSQSQTTSRKLPAGSRHAEGNLKRHKGTGPLPKNGSMVSPRHEGRLFPKCARPLEAGLNRVPRVAGTTQSVETPQRVYKTCTKQPLRSKKQMQPSPKKVTVSRIYLCIASTVVLPCTGWESSLSCRKKAHGRPNTT